MRPSSHCLLTKWPAASFEFESPALDALSAENIVAKNTVALAALSVENIVALDALSFEETKLI